MLWRAQATNLLQLLHKPNWTITCGSSTCCSGGENITLRSCEQCGMETRLPSTPFQLCSCSRSYLPSQHTQLHFCLHPRSYSTVAMPCPPHPLAPWDLLETAQADEWSKPTGYHHCAESQAWASSGNPPPGPGLWVFQQPPLLQTHQLKLHSRETVLCPIQDPLPGSN